MDLDCLWKGVLLGVSIAAPIGPVSLLCIRRTLKFGRASGFCSGLGAAAGDTLYGALAAFGISLVCEWVLASLFWLRWVGAFLLIYLGAKTLREVPSSSPRVDDRQSLLSDFLSTFLLTITSPLTLLSYFALFTALGLSELLESYSQALSLLIGSWLGSMLWWLCLSELIARCRHRTNLKWMGWINQVAGALILACGIWLALCYQPSVAAATFESTHSLKALLSEKDRSSGRSDSRLLPPSI